MTATYAKKQMSAELAGKPVVVHNGAKRDTVTDATLVALWPSNFSATAPVAGTGDITGIMAGWLAAYPRGEVS